MARLLLPGPYVQTRAAEAAKAAFLELPKHQTVYWNVQRWGENPFVVLLPALAVLDGFAPDTTTKSTFDSVVAPHRIVLLSPNADENLLAGRIQSCVEYALEKLWNSLIFSMDSDQVVREHGIGSLMGGVHLQPLTCAASGLFGEFDAHIATLAASTTRMLYFDCCRGHGSMANEFFPEFNPELLQEQSYATLYTL